MKAFSALLSLFPIGASKRAADDIQLWHDSLYRGALLPTDAHEPSHGQLDRAPGCQVSFLRCDVTCQEAAL